MKARVVHHSQPHDVFIGRPGKWGNPFVIGVDGTRNECIKQFARYIRRRHDLMRWIRQDLHDKVLGCFCKPGQRCHGHVLANIAEQEYEAWMGMTGKERRRLKPGYQSHRYLWWLERQVIEEYWSALAHPNSRDCVETDLDEEDPIIRQALIDYLAKDL